MRDPVTPAVEPSDPNKEGRGSGFLEMFPVEFPLRLYYCSTEFVSAVSQLIRSLAYSVCKTNKVLFMVGKGGSSAGWQSY